MTSQFRRRGDSDFDTEVSLKVASQFRSGQDLDLDTEVSKRHLNFGVVEIGTWILSSF